MKTLLFALLFIPSLLWSQRLTEDEATYLLRGMKYQIDNGLDVQKSGYEIRLVMDLTTLTKKYPAWSGEAYLYNPGEGKVFEFVKVATNEVKAVIYYPSPGRYLVYPSPFLPAEEFDSFRLELLQAYERLEVIYEQEGEGAGLYDYYLNCTESAYLIYLLGKK